MRAPRRKGPLRQSAARRAQELHRHRQRVRAAFGCGNSPAHSRQPPGLERRSNHSLVAFLTPLPIHRELIGLSMKRVLRLSTATLLSAVIMVNGLGFMQARAMTRFVESGQRTGRPEQLSVFDRFEVLFS